MRSAPAQAAAAIRKELKKNGIVARVTSKIYSMGSNVDVEVTDQTPAAIKQIQAFCDAYAWDNNKGSDLPQARFVFVNNNKSDEMRADLVQYIGASSSIELGFDIHVTVHQVFTGFIKSNFWASRKPRI